MHRSAATLLVSLALLGCGGSSHHSSFIAPGSTTAGSTTPSAPSNPAPAPSGTTTTSPGPRGGAVTFAARLVGTSAVEFAGGFGSQTPPPGATPPPPTLTISATFANDDPSDFNATDPSVGLLVSFSETATGAPTIAVVPLSASIPAGGQADEVAVFTLPQTSPEFWVKCDLVSLDATGQVVQQLSAPGLAVQVVPTMQFPP